MFDFLADHPSHGGAGPRSGSPSLEPLEDRAVPAVIGGVVYHDLNNNGIRETGEVGIAGQTMQLFDSANRVIATTVSNSLGQYAFVARNGVDATPRTSQFALNFSGRTDNSQTLSLPKFDSSLGTLTSVQLIATGSTGSNVKLENLEGTAQTLRATVNNSIQYNINGQTIQGSRTTTLSAALGAFDNGFDFGGTSGRDLGTTTLTALDGTSAGSRLTLSSAADLAAFIGAANETFSVSQSATATSNASGTGNLMAMIRSSVQGSVRVVYTYAPGNGIGPGSYTVVERTQPAGYADGFETRDNSTAIAGSNRTDRIVVGVANNSDRLLTNHFGERRVGSISGVVYHDADRSGALGGTDGAIAGVTVQLWRGATLVATTTTNSAGAYVFGGLVAGTYTVREIQPAGYLQGTNNLGSFGGSKSGDSMTLTLPTGGAATNYNFGEVRNEARPPDPITDPWPSKFYFFGSTTTSGFQWT